MSTKDDTLAIYRDTAYLIDEESELAARVTALEEGGGGGTDPALAGRVTTVEGQVSTLTTTVGGKADTSAMTTALAGKATTASVAAKADVTALANYVLLKNGAVVNMTVADKGTYRVINGDNSDSSTWPDRQVWSFVRPGESRVRPVFIINENGEVRLIRAKANSTALTVYGKEWVADSDSSSLIFEICRSREGKESEWGVVGDGTVLRRGRVDSPVYVAGVAEDVTLLNPPLAEGTVVLRKTA